MRRALLIEDHEAIGELVTRMLEDRGWKILRSTTGFEADAIFAEHNPGLVITDIDMPGGNGLEIIARLRQKRKDLPVIAVTRCAEQKLQLRTAVVCGAGYVLIGPVTARKLDAAVRAVLPGGSMNRGHCERSEGNHPTPTKKGQSCSSAPFKKSCGSAFRRDCD